MSIREEERQKKSCPSRGLGVAAAAIGVGVGAALYYFFSKRPENPDGEGSTSDWSCEQPHAFNLFCDGEESDTSVETQSNSDISHDTEGYITVDETTTTDTSIHDSTDSEWSETSDNPYIDVIPSTDNEFGLDFFNVNNIVSDENNSVTDEWDVTDSSLDIPERSLRELSPLRAIMSNLEALFSPWGRRNNSRNRTAEQERVDLLRAQALSEEEHIKFLKAAKYRERSWSLEECSICFEVMLKDQDLTSLPCAHNFHSSCIAPWLTEQQTCPNCRKAAE